MPFISDNIESEGYITGATISATTFYGNGANLSNVATSTVTGGTVSRTNNNSTLIFNNSTGGTFNVTAIVDTFVTGGTYNSGTGVLNFTNNSASTFIVTGLTDSDKFITAFTYSNNVATIKQNQGQPDLNIVINTMTGLTVNGNTVSTTYSGTSYSGFSLTLTEIVSAETPSTGATLYLTNTGNRKLLGHKSTLGITINYQPAMFNSKICFWNPPGNVTTAPGIFGVGTLTATGTATARAVTTTNLFTRTKRIATVSSTLAGSSCGYRSSVAQYTVGSGTIGIGGFYYVIRFGCGDALTARRQFVGLRSLTAAPTDVEPSTLTNCIGVGHGTANTNLLIYYGGSAAQTPINLGANFPNNTNSTDLYELALFCPSTSNNQVWYQVTRLNTGDVATGILTGVAGTALPASTTLLTNNDYRSNGGAFGAVTLEFISIYIETEN